MYEKTTFKLIPLIPNSKKPLDPKYNEPEYNPTINTNQVAITHLPSGTCSLDIDNYTDSSLFFKKHFNVDLKSLLESNPYIYNGNPNKYKIIFKISTPLRTKKRTKDKKTMFELRCMNKNGTTSIDTIPPSIHPDTKLQYKWIGDFNQMQEIPPWLYNYWQSLLVINTTKQPHNFDTNYDEIWEALNYIDADLPRQDWLNVGMAIHHADTILGENRGYAIFDKWSQSSEKYKQYDTKKTYDSIEFDEKGIKIATLLSLAASNGWRKKTDATSMFANAKGAVPTATIAVKGELINPENILQGLRPAPPDLNLELLPPIIQSVANELSTGIGCDPLVSVLSCLSVAAGAIDSRIKLKLIDGFYVKPILWLMTVGNPSSKKTPASKPIFKVLKKIQSEDHKRYTTEKLLWEGDEAKYNKQKAEYLKYGADPLNSIMKPNDNSNQPPTELRPSPEPLRITIQDITSQKVVIICASNPRGVLCYMDEMASWVKKVCAIGGGEDRSTWTLGHEGSSYERDRVVSNTTFAENFAVSMYGNIQPHILKRYINDLSDDGLLQRFIPAVLRSNFNKVGTPVLESNSIMPQWEITVRQLFALKENTYTLTPEAYQKFRDFQHWYEQFKKDKEFYSQDGHIFMTAIGKIEGLVGRIALVFHLIETDFTPSVSVDTMQRAIAFVKDYVIPSYNFTYSEIGGAKEYIFSIWLTNYIIKKSTKVIILTLSEIKRAGYRQFNQMQINDNFKKDALVRDEMALIESYGWVVPVGVKDAKWQIREELTHQFHVYRKKIIKEREDLIYKLKNN